MIDQPYCPCSQRSLLGELVPVIYGRAAERSATAKRRSLRAIGG